ncbi:vWA domain-containing protein [Actinoplanes couchii]|uniref:VWFA domain-containing protein n=1 Tax=Actinoplanes couchii TaxID=403638 RepID=A0ABQ3XF92_9ACTN|nr:von Willebrand factor type A domain-containing protein [Actinoplanes couchii]MDR6321885.1 Ca-activated chloride channel family protein [Actinoplanes couchii]GID57157.1 hypothetical protein Aco03nite_055610 [Actinoplanes couchii]
MVGACGEADLSSPDGSTARVTTDEDPQSTFAMDVDTASYDYARNLIGQGSVPAPETVRPEEFVNAFRHPYPQPEGDGFSITMDGARLPSNHRAEGETRLLRVGLQTRADKTTTRQDARLTFVVDVSGSMADVGKLSVVKSALKAYAEQARPTDEVAIVTFSDEARILREMSPARDGLSADVDKLRSEGGTDLEKGLTRGYEVARAGFREGATNRVVLVSDALANIGSTEASPILTRVREAAAKQITLLGVGVGNDYGDRLMEELADGGDGFTVYISGEDDARDAFVNRLPATLTVRALDAKAQVTFDEDVVESYRLIGYDNRKLSAGEFRDDSVDGGEVMAGHSVTALYLVRLRPGAEGNVAHARLRWQDPQSRTPQESGSDVTVATLNLGYDDAAAGLQVSYVAAWFAEQLRHSEQAAEITRSDLITLAERAASRADDPAVTELATLIRNTRD